MSTRAQLREFIQSRLVHGTAGRGDNATLRAGLAASMLVGVVTARQIVGVPALVAANTEQLVATLGPAIGQILASRPAGARGGTAEI